MVSVTQGENDVDFEQDVNRKMVRRGQNLKVEVTGLTNKLEVDNDKKRKMNDDSKDLEENHSMLFSFLSLYLPESHPSLYKLQPCIHL